MNRPKYSVMYCSKRHFIQDSGEPLMTTTCDICEEDFNSLKSLPLTMNRPSTVQFTRLPTRERCTLDLDSLAMMYVFDEDNNKYVIVGRC